MNAFVGCGEKTACMAATAAGISRSIWPTALGVGIGVIASCGYRTLSAAVEQFDQEMKAAARELINSLVAYRGQWSFTAIGDRVVPGGIFDAEAPEAASGPCTVVTVVALLLAGLLQLNPMIESVAVGAAYTAFVFGVCFALARLVRVKRHRRAAVAAVLTLTWTALEIMLRVS